MSTFGDLLSAYGQFRYGKSRYNPQMLPKNCVFVTFAFLLGKSPYELQEHVSRILPDSHDYYEGVMLFKIFNVADVISNYALRNRRYQNGATFNNVHEFIESSSNGKVGVIYLRNSGFGHALVAMKTNRDQRHPDGLKFICYQVRTQGLDLTHEVLNCRGFAVFSFSR